MVGFATIPGTPFTRCLANSARPGDPIRASLATESKSCTLLPVVQPAGRARGFPPYWKVVPYTLPPSSLPGELRQADSLLDPQALVTFIEDSQDTLRGLKSPYTNLEPDGCINCGSEAVNLANIILERNRGYSYSFNTRFPLEDYLRLLRSTHSPLFLGDATRPLDHAVRILSTTGAICLYIDRDELGLHLSPRLVVAEAPLPVEEYTATSLSNLRLIVENPPWLLMEHSLFELANPSGLSLLDFFQSESSGEQPVLTILTEQEGKFHRPVSARPRQAISDPGGCHHVGDHPGGSRPSSVSERSERRAASAAPPWLWGGRGAL